MTIRSFELLQPRSVPEAAGLLTEYGDDARVIGGGTTLVILMKQRALYYPYLIDLQTIPGLREIKKEPDGVRIGTLVTHRMVETSPLIREKVPVIAEAFSHVGNVRVRQTASVGGNLAHADYRLDPPPPLLFNMDDDPYEQKDLSAQHPDILRRMQTELDKWFESVEAERTGIGS